MILPMVAMFLVALAAWTGVGCAADSDAPLTDSEARQFEEILIGVYESSMAEKPHFSSGLNVIQNSIVAYNSDRLNYKTDVTQLGDKYVARDNYVGIVRVAPASAATRSISARTSWTSATRSMTAGRTTSARATCAR